MIFTKLKKIINFFFNFSYWTDEIKELITELTNEEKKRDYALRNTIKALFKKFDNEYENDYLILYYKKFFCLKIIFLLIKPLKF